MARTVKHFSLHRIAGTELRVVADVEAGVLPFIQVEETVIRGYARQRRWPHRAVTLFILQDLQPLVRQLHPGASFPPGGAPVPQLNVGPALDHRPVINVYDLADPDNCHVFVNQQAMVEAGYWDDALAIQGLLAHEHAHPLAENDTTRASRRLRLEVMLNIGPTTSGFGGTTKVQPWRGEKQEKVEQLLTLMASKLCCYAPREIFANQMTLTCGFGDALLYLNRLNVTQAGQGVVGREALRRQLQQAVAQGDLTAIGAEWLLFIGDLRGHLDLALEIAPFYRAGWADKARELEAILEQAVFAHLDPQVAPIYTWFRDQYITLRENLTGSEMVSWGTEILNRLAEALAERGLVLNYHLQLIDS